MAKRLGSDLLHLRYPNAKPLEIRAHLGSMGMGGSLALQRMNTLSGGQKSRVAFAQVTPCRMLDYVSSSHVPAVTYRLASGAAHHTALVSRGHKHGPKCVLKPVQIMWQRPHLLLLDEPTNHLGCLRPSHVLSTLAA